ncbi:MAG TPA: CPBP family glutamic-type intramembrane protease, partial [Oligoflexia bacterium]|nr:CPBP family glutamic-type intramembrane protease [Oligoflexia bacterium]
MNSSCDDIMLNRRALWIGIVVETALSAVFLLWAWLTGFEDRFLPLPRDILSGLAGALSLFSLNVLFFQIAAPRITYLRGCVRFVDEVLKPLADLFNWRSAIFISVIAGAGEELFFRGVVQNECGLLAASVLFALVHFGPS